MSKLITVVGARPQFIKAAIVSEELKKADIQETFIHTGQHYDYNLSDIFFTELDIQKPKYNLEVGSKSHAEQTAEMMIKLEKIFKNENCNLVLVYGDTNSTLAAALTSAKLGIPVAHIEAGLRRYNFKIPEEINRHLTDHISTLLFVPSQISVDNLSRENITNNVFNYGDVMFDLAMKTIQKIDQKKILKKYKLVPNKFIYCTIHRVENTNNKKNLIEIWQSFNEIAKLGLNVLVALHPRTMKYLREYNINIENSNIKIVEPVPYSESLTFINNSLFVVTDSGGLQRESYYLKKQAIVLTENTGWIEPVELGWNYITGAKKNKIIEASNKIIQYSNKLSEWIPFYGNGNAGELIAKKIKSFMA